MTSDSIIIIAARITWSICFGISLGVLTVLVIRWLERRDI